jgi:hypothetical protein
VAGRRARRTSAVLIALLVVGVGVGGAGAAAGRQLFGSF